MTAPAPRPSHRLIPSRFPPIGLFDTVATGADLAAVLDLVGWTDDRLVVERLSRLPGSQWVFGRPNSSVVMASFLHVAPGGTRFDAGELGAWYAAAALRTAVAEVGHHLRREAVATGAASLRRTYRACEATLAGLFVDLRGQASTRPDLYDPTRYVRSQAFGKEVRAAGGSRLINDSLRHVGGQNVVAYVTRDVRDVVQADHYEITVAAAAAQIQARKLAA